MIDMNKIIIVLIFIVLVGCTRYVEVEKNVTIEKIVYRNITTVVKEECNTTFTDVWDISKSRELELIRRIKFLESKQDDCLNDVYCEGDLEDCEDNLDDTEDELEGCEDTLDDVEDELEDYEDTLDDTEDELEDCEEEICDLNSSWC